MVDTQRVDQLAETAFGYLSGAIVAGMIYLGMNSACIERCATPDR